MEALTGRKTIYTEATEIDAGNVVQELEKALKVHAKNSADIDYLYNYYKGKQPILDRIKTVRPEINNKIVENRAYEIVSFKVGYLLDEPIQYVCQRGEAANFDGINLLNAFMEAENKATKDKELADWFTICGTAYRLLTVKQEQEEDEAPFNLYTLDPRYSFIVYSSGIDNKKMMGVKYVKLSDNTILYSVYTDNAYYEICEGKITSSEFHSLGEVPMFEYQANMAKIGAFEMVLPLLDAINKVSSNRVDGIEQFIQGLIILKNLDLSVDEINQMGASGAIKIPIDSAIEYLVSELDQTQTQKLVDHLYQTVLTICGMPNRNGGSSTSDTGTAVVMRDGWKVAENRAKDTELMFRKSEREFLKTVLFIVNTLSGTEIKPSNIRIKFTRQNHENILEKTQVLAALLGTGKVHPKYAFELSGLFSEPDLACQESMQYESEQVNEIVKGVLTDETETVSRTGQSDSSDGSERSATVQGAKGKTE